jgi:hypothetical protein
MLLGKSTSDVQTLLGRPTSENNADHSLTYVIKTGGSGFNQVFVLDVRVNPKSDLVENVIIRGD